MILTLLLVMTNPEESQMPEADTSEKQVLFKKESSVEMKVMEVEGQVRLPQGFSTLSVEAAPNESYLKDRLGFRLWETNKLGY